MRTKKVMIIFLIAVSLYLPKVNAETNGSLITKVTGTLLENETITVRYSGNGFSNSNKVKDFQIVSSYEESKLKKVTCYSTLDGSFHDTSTSGSINLNISMNQTMTGNQDIAICQFKIIKGGDTELSTSLTVTTENGEVTMLPSKKDTLSLKEAKSSNASLSNITLSKGTLSPSFQASILSYTAEVDSNTKEITIKVTKGESGQTVDEEKTVTLNYGENVISIPVVAEDGSSKTYQIKITRKKGSASDTTLQSLSIKGVTFNEKFSSSTKTYTATVPYELEKVYVQAKTTNEKASILVTGATNLTSGKVNVIYVTVTAEDSTKEDYVIKITRQAKNNTSTSTVKPNTTDKENTDKDNKEEKEDDKEKEEEKKPSVITPEEEPKKENNNTATIIEANDEVDPVKQIILIAGIVTLIGLSGIAIYHYVKNPKRSSYDDE